jgi:hypothetical protein
MSRRSGSLNLPEPHELLRLIMGNLYLYDINAEALDGSYLLVFLGLGNLKGDVLLCGFSYFMFIILIGLDKTVFLFSPSCASDWPPCTLHTETGNILMLMTSMSL